MGLLAALTEVNNTFQDIIDETKDVCVRDTRQFLATFSTGKDSSLALALVWRALEQLIPSQRTKQVHVVTSDTNVEEPTMTAFVRHSVRMIEQSAAAQQLPIVTLHADRIVSSLNVQFIVCDRRVKTEKEARAFLDEWLGFTQQVKDVNAGI